MRSCNFMCPQPPSTTYGSSYGKTKAFLAAGDYEPLLALSNSKVREPKKTRSVPSALSGPKSSRARQWRAR